MISNINTSSYTSECSQGIGPLWSTDKTTGMKLYDSTQHTETENNVFQVLSNYRAQQCGSDILVIGGCHLLANCTPLTMSNIKKMTSYMVNHCLYNMSKLLCKVSSHVMGILVAEFCPYINYKTLTIKSVIWTINLSLWKFGKISKNNLSMKCETNSAKAIFWKWIYANTFRSL